MAVPVRAVPVRVAAVAVVVSLLAACGASSSSPSNVEVGDAVTAEDVVEVASVTVDGDPLPAPGSAEADEVVGRVAPTLSGTDFDGSPVTIGPDGVAKVVVVVASWCSHCQEEMPFLVDWLAAGGLPDGVEMVALSSLYKEAYPDRPSAWLAREGWPLPVLRDDADSSAAEALGLPGTPYFLFLDGDSTVMRVIVGNADAAALDAAVAELAAVV